MVMAFIAGLALSRSSLVPGLSPARAPGASLPGNQAVRLPGPHAGTASLSPACGGTAAVCRARPAAPRCSRRHPPQRGGVPLGLVVQPLHRPRRSGPLVAVAIPHQGRLAKGHGLLLEQLRGLHHGSLLFLHRGTSSCVIPSSTRPASALWR